MTNVYDILTLRNKKGEMEMGSVKKKKSKKIFVSIVILLIIAVIAIFAVRKIKSNQETDENAVNVQSVAVLTGASNMEQNRFSGVVISQKTVKLQKQENRTIKKVYVEVGQAVKAGDKLFEYDTDDINTKIEQANLEVEKLQNAITNSKKQIETINAEKNANPGGDHASYNIEIQTLQNEIKQTEYNVKSKKAEITALKKSLQNVIITSEIDGIVQSIQDSGSSDDNNPSFSDNGNAQDNSYMSIMQTGQYRVKGTVNEQNMFSISAGDKVLIHSRIDENITWTGTIESIDTSNPETGNNNGYVMMGEDDSKKSSRYPFYINLDSMEGLMMGQHVFIEKNIGQQDQKEGLWLSNYYIVEENGEAFVWVADSKDKLEKRKIEVGQKDENLGEYHILSGLTTDDYIAIPQENLQEGSNVNKFDTMVDIPDVDFSDEQGEMQDQIPAEGGEMMLEENMDGMMQELVQ